MNLALLAFCDEEHLATHLNSDLTSSQGNSIPCAPGRIVVLTAFLRHGRVATYSENPRGIKSWSARGRSKSGWTLLKSERAVAGRDAPDATDWALSLPVDDSLLMD